MKKIRAALSMKNSFPGRNIFTRQWQGKLKFPTRIQSNEILDDLYSFRVKTPGKRGWVLRGAYDLKGGADLFHDDPFLSFAKLPELAASPQSVVEHTLSAILQGSHPGDEKISASFDFAWKDTFLGTYCTLHIKRAPIIRNILGASQVEFFWENGSPRRVTWVLGDPK